MNKILIIEDQPQMRRKLAMILEREHFQVATAPNGLIGLDLARTDPPDLVICDIMMPELDGYEVLEALRADKATATTPFIFLTAKGERVDQRAGMSIGNAFSYLRNYARNHNQQLTEVCRTLIDGTLNLDDLVQASGP